MGTEESLLKLPLAETFNLETAVCSHGLFMMSPNRWDPLSRSLSRPLHLSNSLDNTDIPSVSVDVTICQPQQDPHSLRIEVRNSASGSAPSLSQEQQDALLAQVKRMLRLSEADERNVREFKRIVRQVAQEEGEETQYMEDFSGRVFRSPTLFEDMVKWPRTLSMARALCELQWELQHCSPSISEDFIPQTPAGKESKRRQKVSKVASKLTSRIAESKASSEDYMNLKLDCAGVLEENVQPSFPQNDIESDLHGLNELSTTDPPSARDRIGNFPSPRELANLDESFLAKRCNLGYRAGRILKLARGIVDGQIQLRELEDMCNEASLTAYVKLAEQLSQINGFGPFTRNNVLVCIGFYHVIPTDSETIRHLKQVHARNCTSKTVQMIAESIYGKYAPFQFLAYWSELWHFYEKRFGKLSEMPYSDYKLITATNEKCNSLQLSSKESEALSSFVDQQK
ncbi:ENDO3c domain-containing protein [Citrus sinensis]|uniref:ENDO3c domain-containing protein n=1 Tax=Citrus sinensis TaxID=2711 RepID=A0ACB8K5R1_CITSI|nr:ENDO3c domain-containing protein [Citrus sinensis]